MSLLSVKDLFVNVNDKSILKGLNLNIEQGEIHVIMGPNGSGKSTLANVILNNEEYTKESGSIIFDNKDITNMKTDEIAKLGVFMSFQTPEEIPGISVFNFLKYIKSNNSGKNIKTIDFLKEVSNNMTELNIKDSYGKRDVNVGFSGGEKKKNEILQMLTLNPKLAILDETDSGLDVDAIKTVSKGIKLFKNKNNAVLIITHSTKILEGLDIDYVHILKDGKIVKTGRIELAREIEKNGFGVINEE